MGRVKRERDHRELRTRELWITYSDCRVGDCRLPLSIFVLISGGFLLDKAATPLPNPNCHVTFHVQCSEATHGHMKREQDHQRLEPERSGLRILIIMLETVDYLSIFVLVPEGFFSMKPPYNTIEIL